MGLRHGLEDGLGLEAWRRGMGKRGMAGLEAWGEGWLGPSNGKKRVS